MFKNKYDKLHDKKAQKIQKVERVNNIKLFHLCFIPGEVIQVLLLEDLNDHGYM